MRIIEIEAIYNGAHRNQSFNGVIPAGWAVVPDALETENFPFGEVTVEVVDNRLTVTEWKPMPMPEPEPEAAPDPTELEQLRADVDFIAMEMGVDL